MEWGEILLVMLLVLVPVWMWTLRSAYRQYLNDGQHGEEEILIENDRLLE